MFDIFDFDDIFQSVIYYYFNLSINYYGNLESYFRNSDCGKCQQFFVCYEH